MSPMRNNIMLGTAGHVDHGKTALVRLLTGCETDRLRQEKQRGLTIELGFAPCTMADERIVGVVDVPGHVDFIRNMVAGAQGVDVVIFVIAADDGVMPQTREHLDILTLMGCTNGLVALTKTDLVDEELRELAVEDVRQFIRGTFLEDKPICPVSSVTGAGFDDFFRALNEAVAAAEGHPADGLFRLWIERAFRVAGFGTVVTGIPSAGRIAAGEQVTLLPGGQTTRVRTMQVYGENATEGRAGECLALNLADVDVDDVGRGMMLTTADALRPVRYAEAALGVLPAAPQPLADYAEVHVHVGTADVTGRAAVLETDRHVPPGESRLVQLRLPAPAVLAPGDRFVIRGAMPGLAGGRLTTLGGGRILGVSDTRLRRDRPWTLAALQRRREAIDVPARWVATCLREQRRPLSAHALAGCALLAPAEASERLAKLTDSGEARRTADGRYAHAETIAELADKAGDALQAFHEANPLRAGMRPDRLAEEIDVDKQALALVSEQLTRTGRAERIGEVLALVGAGGRLREEDRRLASQIASALAEAGLQSPLPAELANRLGVSEQRLEEMARLLVDEGTLVRLDAKVLLHQGALTRARQVVLELFSRQRSFTTVEFRDAIGVSRKYAVPLLDYFDTVRLTVRNSNRRTPGVAAREALTGPGSQEG
ncbi:MAG: selenocysteine-specific translation elongation factor [Planctomycetota bacterium]